MFGFLIYYGQTLTSSSFPVLSSGIEAQTPIAHQIVISRDILFALFLSKLFAKMLSFGVGDLGENYS